MKKILMVSLSLFLGTQMINAQEDASKLKAKEFTTTLDSKVNLSPEQEEQVLNLMEGIEFKNQMIQENTDLTLEEKQERISMNYEARDKQLETILSSDQIKLYHTKPLKKVGTQPKQIDPSLMKK